MAKKLYDLAVKTGEYQDRNGQTKGRWQNVGAVMEGNDGNKFIMLSKWFNPAGVPDLSGKNATSESILLSMFKPQDRSGDQSQHDQAKSNGYAPNQTGNDDDIPF